MTAQVKQDLLPCPYLVGHITKTDPDYIADEDGNALWEAEVQCSGGYSEIARTWAGSEDEARQQAEVIAAALAELHTRPSPTSPQGETAFAVIEDSVRTAMELCGNNDYALAIWKALRPAWMALRTRPTQSVEVSGLLRSIRHELAALIPDPTAPMVYDWPCMNEADRECLQRAYDLLLRHPVGVVEGDGVERETPAMREQQARFKTTCDQRHHAAPPSTEHGFNAALSPVQDTTKGEAK